MAAPERAGRYQAVTYWETDGTDLHGDPVWLAPREVSVKWNRRKASSGQPDQDAVQITATLVLDFLPNQGDLFWEGSVSDFDPDEQNDIMEVVSVGSVPDVKGRQVDVTAGLTRFRGTLPPGSSL